MTDSGQQDRGDKLFSQSNENHNLGVNHLFYTRLSGVGHHGLGEKEGTLAYELVWLYRISGFKFYFRYCLAWVLGKMIFLLGEGFLIHTQRRRGGANHIKSYFQGWGWFLIYSQSWGSHRTSLSPIITILILWPSRYHEATGMNRSIYIHCLFKLYFNIYLFWHAESSLRCNGCSSCGVRP